MPDLLAYQPSDSAMFYRPPSRVAVGRAILGYAAAAVLVVGVAYLYGLGLPEVTSLVPRLATVASSSSTSAGSAPGPTAATHSVARCCTCCG